MSHAYVLQLSNDKRYYGSTRNLDQRILQHKNGDVKTTKGKEPILLFSKQFETYTEALSFEMKCKKAKNKKYIAWLFKE